MPKGSSAIIKICDDVVNFNFPTREIKKEFIPKCQGLVKNKKIDWCFDVKIVKISSLIKRPASFNCDTKNSRIIITHGNMHSVVINKKDKKGLIKTLRTPLFFNKILKSIYYYMAISKKYLFLHGAMIAKDKNNGYIFLGDSGMGKSTLCSFAKKRWHIFSDEISLIKQTSNRFYIHFNSFFRPYQFQKNEKPATALLKKIFIISKTQKKNYMKPLNEKNTLKCLLRYSFLPNDILNINPSLLKDLEKLFRYHPFLSLKISSFEAFLNYLQQTELQ